MAGGGYDHRYSAHKNKFVEEWNGRREITEMGFNVDGKIAFKIVLGTVLIPYGIYTLVRNEAIQTGDRRYQNIC